MFVNDAVGLLKDLMKEGTDERDKAEIKIQNGIIVTKMSSKEFGGEYKRTGVVYLCALWAVSLWAAVTNVAQILFAKIFNWGSPLMKIMWEMGRDPKHISSTFVDRFSRYNHQAKWGAAGWKSLDVFYNYWENVQPKLNGNFEGWITRYWIERMENRQAVTNRLKVAVDLIAEALGKFANEPEVRLLSVASGSAQAVIRAMLRHPNANIKAVLIDSDQTALDEARKSVDKASLTNKFTFVLGRTEVLEDVCKSFQPHVVEMVGFLDYRPKKKAIELIGRIRKVLPMGGIFVTCNIAPNPEKIFLDWVLLWPMIYRSPKEFGELLTKGGFENKKVSLVYEPFKIHGIAVAVK